MADIYQNDVEVANIEIQRLRKVCRELAYRLTIGQDDSFSCNLLSWCGMDKDQIKEVMDEHDFRREKDAINSQ